MAGFGATVLLAYVFFPLIGSITSIIYLLTFYYDYNEWWTHFMAFILGALYLNIMNAFDVLNAFFFSQGVLSLFLFSISISPIFIGGAGIAMWFASDA